MKKSSWKLFMRNSMAAALIVFAVAVFMLPVAATADSDNSCKLSSVTTKLYEDRRGGKNGLFFNKSVYKVQVGQKAKIRVNAFSYKKKYKKFKVKFIGNKNIDGEKIVEKIPKITHKWYIYENSRYRIGGLITVKALSKGTVKCVCKYGKKKVKCSIKVE